jgi:hypothetical protein
MGDMAASCNGAPTAVMMAGPSLTEGYPATFPAIRRLDFDASNNWELYDATTFNADLHDANNNRNVSTLKWQKLYSFRDDFQMSDLSPQSFSQLIERMSIGGSSEWELYRGGSNGTTPNIFCR